MRRPRGRLVAAALLALLLGACTPVVAPPTHEPRLCEGPGADHELGPDLVPCAPTP